MVSLIRAKTDDQGLLAVKSLSSRASSSDGWTSERRSQTGNAFKGKAIATKPWADQPWPLIDTPSRTQNITHPALHIANDLANIHNAMVRGLNAIYLQAPHVRQVQDIADLLFLTQSWSAWLLDHHELKESVMLPGFEVALGVPAGTLTLARNRSPSASSSVDGEMLMMGSNGKDIDDEEKISFLLHRVHAYASVTHKDPHAYDAVTLETLLAALADTLVPHLTTQIRVLTSMREMCFGSPPSSAFPTGVQTDGIPGPLPVPMVTITRTPSHTLPSPPISPSLSTFSSSSASSTASLPPNTSLSLFPSPPRPLNNRAHSTPNFHKTKPRFDPRGKDMDVIDVEAKDRLARARAYLEADDRANKLMQVYLAADARASVTMDRFIVPPMIVRLRDVTFSPSLTASSSYTSLSTSSSHSGRGSTRGMGAMNGVGGGNMSAWPRMSVPAIHAVADKLSPRHEGAWRFLPCDVWGRPQELPFLG